MLGFLLLWAGLVRWADQTNDCDRRRFDRVLTAGGTLVTVLVLGLASWAMFRESDSFSEMYVHGAVAMSRIDWMTDLAWEAGRALILTLAHRIHGPGLPLPSKRLLTLAMISSWCYILLTVATAASAYSWTLHVFGPIKWLECGMFVIGHSLRTLPMLVLGWLLATGRLLKAEVATSTKIS